MVTVVKIGGSLFPEHTEKLCEYLCQSKEKLVLINGGGEFANKLREYDSQHHFSNDSMHWCAIKCMDIVGELIADKNKNIELTNHIEDIDSIHKDGKTPLISIFDILKRDDSLKHDWNVTSDSIACWLANKINAKLLILTNVNGIYKGNIFSNNKKIIKKINANELLFFEETCVDKCLPKLLIKYNLDCFVMNGTFPERVLSHLNGDNNYYNEFTYIGGK